MAWRLGDFARKFSEEKATEWLGDFATFARKFSEEKLAKKEALLVCE
jgi:hypothetical protein